MKIETRITIPDAHDFYLDWYEATTDIEIANINFDRIEVRINDVVYTEDSAEFREAFEAAKFWMKLKE